MGRISSQEVFTFFPPPHPITIKEPRSITEILSLNWSSLRNYYSACTNSLIFLVACGPVYLTTCSENSDKTHLSDSLNKLGQLFSDIDEHINTTSCAGNTIASSSRWNNSNFFFFWRMFGAAIFLQSLERKQCVFSCRACPCTWSHTASLQSAALWEWYTESPFVPLWIENDCVLLSFRSLVHIAIFHLYSVPSKSGGAWQLGRT